MYHCQNNLYPSHSNIQKRRKGEGGLRSTPKIVQYTHGYHPYFIQREREREKRKIPQKKEKGGGEENLIWKRGQNCTCSLLCTYHEQQYTHFTHLNLISRFLFQFHVLALFTTHHPITHFMPSIKHNHNSKEHHNLK